ncbi:MAG: hypothetical protein E7160_02755 [Firmicutes bacterium]|nr:hypothetical protein [Bacillota bacterium]
MKNKIEIVIDPLSKRPFQKLGENKYTFLADPYSGSPLDMIGDDKYINKNTGAIFKYDKKNKTLELSYLPVPNLDEENCELNGNNLFFDSKDKNNLIVDRDGYAVAYEYQNNSQLKKDADSFFSENFKHKIRNMLIEQDKEIERGFNKRMQYYQDQIDEIERQGDKEAARVRKSGEDEVLKIYGLDEKNMKN